LIWRNQSGSCGVTSGKAKLEVNKKAKKRGKIPMRSNEFLEETKI